PLTPYGSTLQQSLTLTALSSADVTVTLALTNSGPTAYQLDTPTSLDIPGLGSQTVQITFAPQLPATILATVQTLNATLSVGSNDPNHLSTPVSITGSA